MPELLVLRQFENAQTCLRKPVKECIVFAALLRFNSMHSCDAGEVDSSVVMFSEIFVERREVALLLPVLAVLTTKS